MIIESQSCKFDFSFYFFLQTLENRLLIVFSKFYPYTAYIHILNYALSIIIKQQTIFS